jgi:hypothetical protein
LIDGAVFVADGDADDDDEGDDDEEDVFVDMTRGKDRRTCSPASLKSADMSAPLNPSHRWSDATASRSTPEAIFVERAMATRMDARSWAQGKGTYRRLSKRPWRKREGEKRKRKSVEASYHGS